MKPNVLIDGQKSQSVAQVAFEAFVGLLASAFWGINLKVLTKAQDLRIVLEIEFPEIHILNLPLGKGYRLLSVNQPNVSMLLSFFEVSGVLSVKQVT